MLRAFDKILTRKRAKKPFLSPSFGKKRSKEFSIRGTGVAEKRREVGYVEHAGLRAFLGRSFPPNRRLDSANKKSVPICENRTGSELKWRYVSGHIVQGSPSPEWRWNERRSEDWLGPVHPQRKAAKCLSKR